jgi:hypothetical protein
MRTAIPLTVLVTGLACSLVTAPAQARARVFVASFGNDSNPCTFGSPCKTFQQAVNVVDVGGEVTAIDSAGFGPINITKSVTITSPPGVEAGIAAPASGKSAITIDTASSNQIMNLIGLTLDGANVSNTVGISFIGLSGILNVRDSVIRNFGSDGINFEANASSSSNSDPSQFNVSNTVISDNGNIGIVIEPVGLGPTTGVLDHVQMENNASEGLRVRADAQATQTVKVTVSDSVSANNAVDGIFALSVGGKATVMVRNSILAYNQFGLETNGAGATIRVTRSTITGNQEAWFGTVLSYGDNNIDDNGNANTEPPNPLTYK